MAARPEPAAALSGGPVFDRTPPQSIEAERSVLGAMLLNPSAVGTAIEVLREHATDVFYVEAHQHIYEAVLSLLRRAMPIDPTTLVEQLNRDGKLDAAGGAAYLGELSGAVPTSANIEYYAKIVLEAALLRRIISTCTRVAGEAYKAQGEVEDLLDRAESERGLAMVRARLEAPDCARLLLVIRDWHGFEMDTLFSGTLFSGKLELIGQLDRYAVVGGPDWLGGMASMIGGMIKPDVRAFDLDDLDDAVAWLEG